MEARSKVQLIVPFLALAGKLLMMEAMCSSVKSIYIGKKAVLRSQNRTRDLSITMKLLQSNVINQLHQAEGCNRGCACLIDGHVNS